MIVVEPHLGVPQNEELAAEQKKVQMILPRFPAGLLRHDGRIAHFAMHQ